MNKQNQEGKSWGLLGLGLNAGSLGHVCQDLWVADLSKPNLRINTPMINSKGKLWGNTPNGRVWIVWTTGLVDSRAQQRLYEVRQLFVWYVFALKVSGKYLKVTFSHT